MGSIWLDKFLASDLGRTEFLLGQGLIGYGQLSGPEGPQGLDYVEAGAGQWNQWVLAQDRRAQGQALPLAERGSLD